MLDLRLFRNRDVHRREHRDAARRARDVRRVLLRLALHPADPRLLAGAGGRELPPDDDPDRFLAPIAGKQTDRIGSRWLTGAGMLLAAVSLLIFSRLDTGSSYWDILPGLVVGGIGMALTMTPTTAAAMSSVPRDQAGVGSAVLNSMRQVGGSLGIAVTGAIVAARQRGLARGRQPAAGRVRRRIPGRARGRGGDRRRRGGHRRRDHALPRQAARRSPRGAGAPGGGLTGSPPGQARRTVTAVP